MDTTEHLNIQSEDTDDLVAVNSRVSVASSDFGNISSNSSSSAEHELSARDIVNWRECWNVWTSGHRVVPMELGAISSDLPHAEDIFAVFRLAYTIPQRHFFSEGPIPDALQNYISQISRLDPGFFDSDNVSSQASTRNGLDLAAIALDLHETVSRLVSENPDSMTDEQWTTQIHNPLILRCAHGCLLEPSESWPQAPLDSPYSYSDASLEDPAVAHILNVRKIRPHGAIYPMLENERGQYNIARANGPVSSVTFVTREQIVSLLRDTPEPVSLHAFSIMSTTAALAQLAELNLSLPVFGVMFDQNIVRFHADWNMTDIKLGIADPVHVTAPLAQPDATFSRMPPFRDFDLGRPDDALRIVFIFNELHSYTQNRFIPALQATRPPLSSETSLKFTPLVLDELKSSDKVQAWMQSGAADAVEASYPDLQ